MCGVVGACGTHIVRQGQAAHGPGTLHFETIPDALRSAGTQLPASCSQGRMSWHVVERPSSSRCT